MANWIYRPILVAIALLLVAGGALAEWDYSNALIAVDEIISGGPPKDGIPALTDPETVAAAKANFLSDNETVLGLVHRGEARAYPLRLLSWHELVNDTVGGKPVLVSW